LPQPRSHQREGLARRVTRLLAATYGSPNHDNKRDPLDDLVFIILSQMTTHHSFGRVFDRLKERYPEWDQVASTPLRRLRSVIKDAGLSNQKAPRLKAIVTKLRADFGRATLDPLRHWSTARAESYLTSLPGVGTKTAKCVLMYALDRRVLPVDTHVWRVARRIGQRMFLGIHQRVAATLVQAAGVFARLQVFRWPVVTA